MEVDNLLNKYVGEIGPYQVFVVILAGSIAIVTSFDNVDYAFVSAIPQFRCNIGNISHLEANFTFTELIILSSPKQSDSQYDTCHAYERNYSSMSEEEARQVISGGINFTDAIVKCTRWIYSQEIFISTIVTEWDLVCDKAWLVATSQSIIMAGLTTTIVGGWFADKFGRRKVALACLAISSVARLVAGVSPVYYVYITARFVMTAVGMTWYTTGFIIAVEIVGPKWRVFAGQVPYYGWSIGFMTLAGMAYLIRDWRVLVLTLLGFHILFLLHICFLPESVRWLVSKDKNHEASKSIIRMARYNGKQIPEKELVYSKGDKKQQSTGTWKDMFKSYDMLRYTAILIFIWFALVLLFYGLVFYLSNLGGNVFLSTFLAGVLEIPSLIYVQLTLDTRLGRRINTSLTLICSSLALFSLLVIPKEIKWLQITLALIGRLAVSSAFSIVFVYTAEIYPTLFRGFALSVCQTVSRIAGIVAPFVAMTGSTAFYIPPIIFGSFSLIAGIIVLFLPETRGKVLQDRLIIKEDPSSNSHRYQESLMMDVQISDTDQTNMKDKT